jgi:ferredoxin
MTLYRIEIDRSLCSGFGTCVDLAPDLIQLDGSSIAALRVGETDDELALEAAASCPMGAIAVYDLATGRQAE